MSFDIFLQSVHDRGEPRQMINPFTGEPATIFPHRGLEPDERDAICGVIAAYQLAGQDDFGCYPIDLPDGGSAELFASNFADHRESCDGMMVACRNLTPKLARFIFDLMDRGNMAALPAMEDTRAFVASEHWSDFTPGDGAPPTVVVRSPAELHAALTGGYEGWQRYRDQITG